MPAFGRLSAGSRDQRLAAFADAAWRKEAEEQMLDNTQHRSFEIRYDRISVAESSSHPEFIGRTISNIAGSDRSGLDIMVELALADDLKTRFEHVMFNYDEDDVAKLLAQESSLLGLSDAGAHASQICDSAFALHLLGRFVRERGDFPLEFGIWRLTGHPASVFGIHERGLLKEGYFADICVFDPNAIKQTPSIRVYDLPASADRLIKHPIGIEHVMVNGGFIRRNGQSHVGTGRGRLLGP
jgi:N-acyl-D-amino-acid deacylase